MSVAPNRLLCRPLGDPGVADEREQASEWSGWRLEVTDRAGSVVFPVDLACRAH
jgi:hypothetical protein